MSPDPVRVFILSNSLNTGGAERFAESLLKGLDRRRARPRLVLLRDDIGYSLPRDVPVDVLGYRSAKDLPKAVLGLRRLIRKAAPHVLVGVGTSGNVVIGLALLALKRRPAWIAGVDTNPNRRDLRLRMKLLGRLYPMADTVVACSVGMQKTLKAHFPKEKDKIECLFYPTDFETIDRAAGRNPAWTRISGGPPMLVTVGRAHRVKRWDLLLDAAAIVLKTRPVQLVFCGDGPLLEELKAKARGMNIHNHIHFPGHCSNPFSILRQADLFLLSSDAEGLPHALIEAQGLGLCAVSTRCEFGPDEIIGDGQTGLLVDVGNAGQMARAILALTENASLRTRMGAKARERVRERFDFRRRCQDWEDLIVRSGTPG